MLKINDVLLFLESTINIFYSCSFFSWQDPGRDGNYVALLKIVMPIWGSVFKYFFIYGKQMRIPLTVGVIILKIIF